MAAVRGEEAVADPVQDVALAYAAHRCRRSSSTTSTTGSRWAATRRSSTTRRATRRSCKARPFPGHLGTARARCRPGPPRPGRLFRGRAGPGRLTSPGAMSETPSTYSFSNSRRSTGSTRRRATGSSRPSRAGRGTSRSTRSGASRARSRGRGPRRDRRERLGQEHALQDPRGDDGRDVRLREHPGTDRVDPRAGLVVSPDDTGRRNVILQAALAGSRARRSPRRSRDRGVRRARRLLRPAREDVLVGHADAARVLGRDRGPAGRDPPRRGARRGRRPLPEEVRRPDLRARRPRGRRSSSAATRCTTCRRSATARSG